MKNRRKLMEATRDFKKAPRDDRDGLFAPLLKSYQEEVDNLTKRAKLSESAFLSIFQPLYDAPDPVAALVTATRVADIEAENQKLQAELDEFRSEASTLKNQDLTVRRLEERNRALEVQMEQRAAALVSSKLTSMEEESVRAMELLKERERYLVTQLDATAITVTALRRETDTAQNEMFELKAAYEEERAARQAEMELLQTDLEAAEARLLAVDRERQRATTADARGRGDGEGDGNGPVAAAAGGVSLEKFREVESAAEEHERRVSLLLREAAAAEGAAAAAAAERAALATALNAARAEAEAAAEALAATQAMLDDRPTHEQLEALRAQVAALQAVGGWDENDDAGAAGESSIEGLLVKKNRHLEHEVTTLKRQLCDSQAAADAADAKAAAATATAAEQQRLVKQLEEDLARQDTVDSGPDVWGAETEAAQATLLAMASGGDVEQGARSRESGSQSVVKVLAGQRDRFKERTLQLEEQLRAAHAQVAQQESVTAQLRSDNLALYERIRFVQDYQRDSRTIGGAAAVAGAGTGAGAGATGDANPGRRDSAGQSAAVMRKYATTYEEGINPFQEFRRREREGNFKDLGVTDRMALTTSKFVLTNQYTRAFAFFYMVALHLLVMAVLWSMSLQAMHHTASLPTEEMCSRQRLMASALQVFRDADADHNGMLDASEFEHALEEESVQG